MVRKTSLTFALCSLLVAAPQVFASFDMEDCKWSDDSCLLKGTPTFNPENDSRDNLLRLLSGRNHLLCRCSRCRRTSPAPAISILRIIRSGMTLPRSQPQRRYLPKTAPVPTDSRTEH